MAIQHIERANGSSLFVREHCVFLVLLGRKEHEEKINEKWIKACIDFLEIALIVFWKSFRFVFYIF